MSGEIGLDGKTIGESRWMRPEEESSRHDARNRKSGPVPEAVLLSAVRLGVPLRELPTELLSDLASRIGNDNLSKIITAGEGIETASGVPAASGLNAAANEITTQSPELSGSVGSPGAVSRRELAPTTLVPFNTKQLRDRSEPGLTLGIESMFGASGAGSSVGTSGAGSSVGTSGADTSPGSIGAGTEPGAAGTYDG